MSELEKQNTVESKNQVSFEVSFEGKEGGSPRIMFLGNSITRHGVRAEVGWFNNWGMAASSKENDYVHRVISFVQELHPDAAFCIVQGADWERAYKDYDFDEKYSAAKSFNPDVMICLISENIPMSEFEEEAFAENMHKFHTYLKGENKDCVIIQASSFFSNAGKDKGIKLCSERYGTIYVDIFDISRDESNLAIGLFEHKGVQIHPGDKGMKAIADRFIEELKKIL